MLTLHAKTDAGRLEVETRARRLPPALRSALILIDGKRTDEELAAMVPQFATALPALLEAGLVAPVQARPRPAAPARPQAPAAAPAPSLEPQPARSADPAFLQRRRDAARTVIDTVGPAGEVVAVRIERAANAEELAQQVELAATLIGNLRGRRAGIDFAQRFGLQPAANAP